MPDAFPKRRRFTETPYKALVSLLLCWAIETAPASIIINSYRLAAPGGGGSWTERATDNFNSGANGDDLTTSGNWTSLTGVFTYFSGTVQTFTSSDVEFYTRNGTFGADQYSQGTIVAAPDGSTVVGVGVRMQAGINGYIFWYNAFAGGLELARNNSGTRTAIGSPAARTYSGGEKLRLEAVGTGSATRLTAYEDTGSGWVAVFTAVDPGGTYIDGGKPAIVGYGANGDRLDNHSAGDR